MANKRDLLEQTIENTQQDPRLTLGQKAFAMNILRNYCKPKQVSYGVGIARRYVELVTHPSYAQKTERLHLSRLPRR